MSNNTIKIQIIGDYQNYKKGQIIDLDEKTANTLLTNSKAIRIHRKSSTNETTKEDLKNENTENKIEENSEEKSEKGNKNPKK